MGFASYFLIVRDFIAYAREQGIGVGPGRGSVAGSLVAYVLRITDIDPIQHGLIFERFLNPERVNMPDIDIDFDDLRRGEVIEYVKRKYGEGNVTQVAARWNIHPGMEPIEWLIAPEVAALDDAPGFEDIDLVGAFVDGIEGWNDAFGFPVFTARVARPDEEIWQDDKNYVLLDPNPSAGFAFADWRTNPNTGEVRGADVYLGAGWLDPWGFYDDPEESTAIPAALKKDPPKAQKVPGLHWDGVGERHPLCVMSVEELRAHGGKDALTSAQKMEKYISHVAAHEIGHTLSLRHNFKGSLVPVSSSVMDYLWTEDRIVRDLPYLLAEVVYAVESEMAMTLADVLVRRLHIAFEVADHGRAAARVARAIEAVFKPEGMSVYQANGKAAGQTVFPQGPQAGNRPQLSGSPVGSRPQAPRGSPGAGPPRKR